MVARIFYRTLDSSKLKFLGTLKQNIDKRVFFRNYFKKEGEGFSTKPKLPWPGGRKC